MAHDCTLLSKMSPNLCGTIPSFKKGAKREWAIIDYGSLLLRSGMVYVTITIPALMHVITTNVGINNQLPFSNV